MNQVFAGFGYWAGAIGATIISLLTAFAILALVAWALSLFHGDQGRH